MQPMFPKHIRSTFVHKHYEYTYYSISISVWIEAHAQTTQADPKLSQTLKGRYMSLVEKKTFVSPHIRENRMIYVAPELR